MTVGPVEIGQRSETVRRANLGAIVRELHAHGALSRSELVARTGLTRSAIRSLVGELVHAGLAAEGPATRLGTPGRPSPVVRLVAGSAVVVALDIAVDSLAAAIVGLGGRTLARVRIERSREHSSVDEIAADLTGLARTVLGRRPAAEPVVGIGVAVVGVVRRSDGVVSMAPNLGWRDIPLGDRLARALDLSVPISVANEADLGTLAELRRGAAVGADDLVYISGEVGVGGGVIVGGRPLTGVAGYAGEVGHMPVNPEGAPCRCGSVGCWETEVGEDALLVRAGLMPGGGRAAVDAVLREAAAGSATAQAALDHVGTWLGLGLASLVNLLNPQLIVLGGRFGRMYPFVTRALHAELDRRTLPAARSLVTVIPTSLGVDAPLLGAAELALEPLLADPAQWVRPRDTLPELKSA
ncbi:MAG TPA: ROK family protein [Candidatus Limnocylindrales bacterium]